MKRFTQHMIVRYILSGGASAFVNLSVFFMLFHFVHFFYLTASVYAFCTAFLLSLFLQKFWTFRDHSRDVLHMQAGKYFILSLLGLAFNVWLLYVFVGHLHVHPFIGQILAGGITACCTFPVSRRFVFNQHN